MAEAGRPPAAAPRVAVVGGGWAGCAAAVTLAAAGIPVTLFERAKTLGGRARRVSLGTFALDNGQHLLIGAYDPYTEPYLRALARVTPDLPDDVRILRFAVGKDLVNRLLGQPNGQVHLWVEHWSPGADSDMAASLVDLLVGMFRAPVTKPAKTRSKP